uniref:Uncharacterized protein n=1 Tax=Arion vulgaris TaxID=1028688 RepID=A0A0B7C181_9EUPU
MLTSAVITEIARIAVTATQFVQHSWYVTCYFCRDASSQKAKPEAIKSILDL